MLRVVERRPDNNLLVDKAYIPPVLACRASPVLGGFLREIRGLLGQRGEALAARLAQPGAGGVAEIADFIFLLTINRHQPVFDHLAELTQLHPERLFSQLLALSGELATLVGNERRPAPLPAYNHDALEACFAPLIRDIRRALATVLEQNADGQPLAPREHHPVALAHRPAIDRRGVAAHVDEDEVRPVELDARLHAGDVPLRVGQRQLVALLPADRAAPAVEVETQRPG